MLELFKRSGVPFEVYNSHTTVDAPPTVYHIRQQFERLEEQGIKATIKIPKYKGKRVTMWTLIPQKKMPPTRFTRYCCEIMKEGSCKNRFLATGVRWAESNARRGRAAYETINKNKSEKVTISDEIMLMEDNSDKRKLTEHCIKQNEMVVNPIIDWTNRDIWEFIRSQHIKYNPLYDCGYERVGCVGCPMASKRRWKEFRDFPTYQRAYIRAFDKMLEALWADSKKTDWRSGEDVFRWWMEDKNVAGQMALKEFIEY